MRKLALLGATVVAAIVLPPLSFQLKWSAEKTPSVSQDKTFAIVRRPATADALLRPETQGGPCGRGNRLPNG
jgi:hypothetical protein